MNNNLLETINKIGPVRIGIMGAVLFGLLVFFIFVSMRVATPDMQLLYNDLSTADIGAISAKLEETKIAYKISKDGTSISVSEIEVAKARLLLAESGIPNGGSMGYELFDEQSGFGQTSLVQNINKVRALEGELARTITLIDAVRNARVHIVLPERELFSREKHQARASVILKINPGNHVGGEQILAIQSLVSSAVPELKGSDVSIVDSFGNLLAKGGDDGDNVTAAKAEEQRIAREQRLSRQIEELLGRTVGYGKVRATVTADINYDRISLNEEIFDPEGQVLRSAQSISESANETDPSGSDVGIDNNLPEIGGDLLGGNQASSQSDRTEETSNFEISKTIRSTVREVGEVEKLSVAVLVDGRYSRTEEGERVYEPRSQEELDQLTRLVKSAIGFDDDRGDTIEVANMQFIEVELEDIAEDELFGFKKSDLLDTAEIVAIAIMIILVVLLILQPMVSRLLETSDAISQMGEEDQDNSHALLESGDLPPALAPPQQVGGASSALASSSTDGAFGEDLIDMRQVEGKVKKSTVKKVEDIVENYPTEAVSVLRGWMSNEK